MRDRADMIISDPPELKHAPVFRYNRWFRPMFEKTCGVEMELAAVMREPVSWLGSWYRYRQRPFLDGQPNSTKGISFDEFVLAYCKGDKPAFANVGSQAKFLEPQKSGCRVTHLFRYEDKPGITGFLEHRLKTKIDLGQVNVSPKMELALSPDVLSKYRRKCADEFALYDGIS